jgi:hypothetical protein
MLLKKGISMKLSKLIAGSENFDAIDLEFDEKKGQDCVDAHTLFLLTRISSRLWWVLFFLWGSAIAGFICALIVLTSKAR